MPTTRCSESKDDPVPVFSCFIVRMPSGRVSHLQCRITLKMRMRGNSRELRGRSLTVAAWQSARVKCWKRKPDVRRLYSNILVICAMQVFALVEWVCILHPVAQ